MRYQIYVPGATGANLNNLRKVGLEDLVPSHDERPASTETLKGPDGGPGQVWGWPGEKEILAWNPEIHTATPCVADPKRGLTAGRFWWIYSKNGPPDEEDLRRSESFSGFQVMLGDGREWLVPNVLELPESFGFDPQGEIVRVPQKQWLPFVDDAEWAVHECLIATGEIDGMKSWRRQLDVAVRFLSANYRVNLEYVIQHQLITPMNVFEVLMRGIDRNRLLELSEQLKNHEAGAATPAGSGVAAG